MKCFTILLLTFQFKSEDCWDDRICPRHKQKIGNRQYAFTAFCLFHLLYESRIPVNLKMGSFSWCHVRNTEMTHDTTSSVLIRNFCEPHKEAWWEETLITRSPILPCMLVLGLYTRQLFMKKMHAQKGRKWLGSLYIL